MFRLLISRKIRSLANAVTHWTAWEGLRNAAFGSAGVCTLVGLYFGFGRLLRFLHSVPIIGDFLIWKLTALALMTTFSMAVLSSLIISLTTLFYSFDLPFLMKSPLSPRVLFADKSLESAFFSCWMIVVALLPFVLALGRVEGAAWPFYVSFVLLTIPFLLLAAAVGIAFTLALMSLFPSPRTRDVIWILSSLSIAVVYVLIRLAQPEKLVRPDALQFVAQYLQYLQAPVAPYLPSWWLTRALWASAGAGAGAGRIFWIYAGLLVGAACAVYGGLIWLAGEVYGSSFSGAQEGRRYDYGQTVSVAAESRVFGRFAPCPPIFFWKDRRSFFRDVRNWSQIMLVAALVWVYLFSIQRLPLDTPDLKSLISFLNLAAAGFVISSLGLRFTFPAISLEGRCFWVIRSAPVDVGALMREKFLFSLVFMLLVSSVLVLASNHLLRADRFIAWLTFGSMVAMTLTLCAMGVGFGAIFPRFDYSNIHQVESSAGGFTYMAASLAYVALTVGLEALLVQMHFQERFGRAGAWHWSIVGWCAAAWLALNAAAIYVPWRIGRRVLEGYEAF